MIRFRTTCRHGFRRSCLRRFLRRPTVASTRTCEYDWGPDRSGTEQGAGRTATRAYTTDVLNQYTSVASAPRIGDRCLTPVANPVEPDYGADGNLIEDDRFEYVYDDENRLVSAYPVSPAASDLAVENFYDHRHRRIQKTAVLNAECPHINCSN